MIILNFISFNNHPYQGTKLLNLALIKSFSKHPLEKHAIITYLDNTTVELHGVDYEKLKAIISPIDYK